MKRVIRCWKVLALMFVLLSTQACLIGPIDNNNNNNTNTNNNNNTNTNTNNNNNNNQTTTGSLLVKWDFEGNTACPADVDEIVVQLQGQDDQIAECSKGQLGLDGLEAGTYTLVVKGIRKNTEGKDEVTWESQSESVTIKIDVETIAEIELKSMAPAVGSMTIKWSFTEVTTCGNEVSGIVVKIKGMDDRTLDCAKGVATYVDLAPGEYFVTLQMLDDQDGIVGETIEQKVVVEAGNEAVLDIPLTVTPPTGTLTIDWDFDGSTTCPADVEEVVVKIKGETDRVLKCEDGTITLNDLPAGEYFVILEGIERDVDDTPIVTWISSEQTVEVLADKELSVDITLSPSN